MSATTLGSAVAFWALVPATLFAAHRQTREGNDVIFHPLALLAIACVCFGCAVGFTANLLGMAP